MLAASICDYIHIHLWSEAALPVKLKNARLWLIVDPPVEPCLPGSPPPVPDNRPILVLSTPQPPNPKHLYPMLAHALLVGCRESTFGAQSSRRELTVISGEALWHSTNLKVLVNLTQEV